MLFFRHAPRWRAEHDSFPFSVGHHFGTGQPDPNESVVIDLDRHWESRADADTGKEGLGADSNPLWTRSSASPAFNDQPRETYEIYFNSSRENFCRQHVGAGLRRGCRANADLSR